LAVKEEAIEDAENPQGLTANTKSSSNRKMRVKDKDW
jgi:hypothetical protein